MAHDEQPLQVCLLRQQTVDSALADIKVTVQAIDRAIRGENQTPGLAAVVQSNARRIELLEAAPATMKDAILARIDGLEERLEARRRKTWPGPAWFNRDSLPWFALVVALLIIAGLLGIKVPSLDATSGSATGSHVAVAPAATPTEVR